LTNKSTDTNGLDNSTDNLIDNSTDDSVLTIPLYNSYLQIRLTIRPYNLADQNGWNDPSVRAATLPWSKAGVSCRVAGGR